MRSGHKQPNPSAGPTPNLTARCRTEVPAGQLGAGLRAPAANWRPWLALAAAYLMAYGDTLVRDPVLV